MPENFPSVPIPEAKFCEDLDSFCLWLYQSVREHFLNDCAALWASELADARTGIIQLSHREQKEKTEILPEFQ
jgi:hypothetical protein